MLTKLSALPVLILILLSDSLQAIAQQAQPPVTPQPAPGYFGDGPWHMWGGGYGWPHWWIGPPMMLIFVAICVAMMFFMMRGRMMHRHRSGHALDLLKERFARGEINRAEYEERKRALEA